MKKRLMYDLLIKENEDGTNGAPALYANIPIYNIKNEVILMALYLVGFSIGPFLARWIC